jgi:hypothetical protein
MVVIGDFWKALVAGVIGSNAVDIVIKRWRHRHEEHEVEHVVVHHGDDRIHVIKCLDCGQRLTIPDENYDPSDWESWRCIGCSRVLPVCFDAPIWSPLVRRESARVESGETQNRAVALRC